MDAKKSALLHEHLLDQELLNALLDSSLDCIIVINHENIIVEYNRAAEVVFGYLATEAIGQRLDELIIPERYRNRHREAVERYLQTGKGDIIGRRVEVYGQTKFGNEIPIELTVLPVHRGGSPYFTAYLRDITERKAADEKISRYSVELAASLEALQRANRALRTLSAGNRTLLRASDEQNLLREMCQVIVQKGGYHVAVVAYAEHDDQRTIRWMSSVGLKKEILETVRYTWADTELGRSAVATAIRTQKPCIGRHLLTDPHYDQPEYAPVREDAIQRGYTSISAFPLSVDGEVLGALGVAASEPDAFDKEEVELLSELAADLAYGIANLRTRVKHREAQATIARVAYYDPLTGLPNRTLLLERLEDAIEVAREQHRSLALLYLELGQFQEINKVLGYQSGDQLVQEVAQRLIRAAHENEILARVGESDFALLMPDAGAELAIEKAQRIIGILDEPVEVSSLLVDARVGIGITLFPDHATNAEALVRRANAAARQANPIKGGYAVYIGGQEQGSTRRLKLVGELRQAIERNELLLYSQPKVEIASRRVCGAEALVRWQHPLHGMISPAEFITLLEQAGSITPLTNWVLDAAFSQSYAWHEAGLELPLSINLSAHDLRDPKLIDRIRGLFTTWGVPSKLIQFELTESALMEDPTSALETLRGLKELNVELYVDDFGTGYCSLSYLQKLPVDWIKIDQSFVMPMAASSDSEVIVRSTIELGHNLGLGVVAEGVENQAVWDRLAALGCDVGQGYFISKPMPADQLRDWGIEWGARIARTAPEK